MFDVVLTVDFLVQYASDILVDFRAFAKNTPIIYMNDIPVKYKNRLASEASARDSYSVLVRKWTSCTQIEKLTILHFTHDNMNLLLLDFSLMVDEMILRVERCKVEHGTMVGVQAAQSLSEKLQQATLNSFHSSGNKKAAQVGLGRLKEILDASKIPSVVFVGPVVSEMPIDLRIFLPKTVKDVVISTEMEQTMFRCKMHPTFEYTHFLSLISNQTLKNSFSFKEQILTYKLPKRKQTGTLAIGTIFNGLMDIHYCGVKGAVDVEDDTIFMGHRTVPTSQTIEQIYNACPNVDLTKLKTNDYVFIQETYGIEAARRYLLDEIQQVLGKEGIAVSCRHLNLIVDNMTYRGEVQANRYSALDINDSVILKSTFQQASTTFCNAAANSTCDEIKDVSSQLMMGKTTKIGVMFADIVLPPCEKEQSPEPREYLDASNFSPEYAPLSAEYHPSSPSGFYETESVGWEAPLSPGDISTVPELLCMDLSI